MIGRRSRTSPRAASVDSNWAGKVSAATRPKSRSACCLVSHSGPLIARLGPISTT
jgi:hypothetical protein